MRVDRPLILIAPHRRTLSWFRALGRILLLAMACMTLAHGDAREDFLKQPTAASATAAWAELEQRSAEDLMAAYDAAAQLYPLDALDPAGCEAAAEPMRSALARNPFALVGLLALSLCAEHVADVDGAARWHASMAQWLSHVLADGRGRSPAQPAWLSSKVDIDGLEIATGLTATGRYVFWHKGRDDGPLLHRVALVDEHGFERELFFAPYEIYRRIAERGGLSSPLADARREFTQQAIDEEVAYDELVQGLVAVRQWSIQEQRDRARELAAAGDAALAYRILLHCLPMEGSAACVDADLDPLLDSKAVDGLVLRGLLLHQAKAGDEGATRTLFKALQRRVGDDVAIAQVWRDFQHLGRMDWLPDVVLEHTRKRADAGAAASAYLLARHPRSEQDRGQADARLQRAAKQGLGAAQVRLARRLQARDPAAAQALYVRAAARGNRLAQLQLLRLEYTSASSERRDELIDMTQRLIRSTDHASALWLAKQLMQMTPKHAALSYSWALQALQSPVHSVADAALELLIEQRVVGKPSLIMLELDHHLNRLRPPDERLRSWCDDKGFAQACRFLFERRTRTTTEPSAVAAKDLALLERAAQLGDREALRQLGQALVRGDYGQTDAPKGLGLIDRASGMGHAPAQNDAAWLRCSSANDKLYQPMLGLSLATHLLSQFDFYVYVDTLAACQAANGKFSEAVASQQRALDEAERNSTEVPGGIDSMRARLKLYGEGRVYRAD